MNGIIYRCVRVYPFLLRMTPLFSSLSLCPNNYSKCGSKSSTTSTLLSICSSPPKWSSWLWMVLLLAARWITNVQGVSAVLKTTRRTFRGSTAIQIQSTASRILKIIQSLQGPPSCSNSTKCCIFLFRRKLNKMTTGNLWVLFSLAQILQDKESIRSWSLWEEIRKIFSLTILTASTERMPISLCWVWLLRWKTL